jgi:creatinine amidohydrolase/Fe(II)-dependent formamide hydrolase-like protein
MTDKLIITNKAALRAKYGTAGLRRVSAAVTALVAADRRRGLVSRLVDLSSAAAMKRHAAPAVTDALHPKQNKDAIDALFRALQPDYLLLLGSIDVIPHQDLANPVYEEDKEDDPKAWSDLPYACDAPYSRDIADFIGPTRVVARLPDLTGARDPAHLLRLLATAARWRARPLRSYAPYYALSVRLWQRSTSQSLENIFGNDDALAITPPASAARSRTLGRLSHFINCHGGLADPQFYGEYRGKFPVAMATRHTRGKIAEGTVAAAECCYGGELYDSVTLALDEPICQSYLAQGAYGWLGSTTIAYGPARGNGAADLITQYFLLAVHSGVSIGHAALAARQRYVEEVAEMDPIDLKTLAQFCIYGDPSVHAVERETPTAMPRGIDVADVHRAARGERRAKLRLSGELLQQTKPTASKASPTRGSASVGRSLASIARALGLDPGARFVCFDVNGGVAPAVRSASGAVPKRAASGERYHLLVTAQPGRRKSDLGGRMAVVAKEAGQRVVGYRVYLQK